MKNKTAATLKVLQDCFSFAVPGPITHREVLSALSALYDIAYEDGERDALAEIPEEREDEPRELVENPQTGFLE